MVWEQLWSCLKNVLLDMGNEQQNVKMKSDIF